MCLILSNLVIYTVNFTKHTSNVIDELAKCVFAQSIRMFIKEISRKRPLKLK